MTFRLAITCDNAAFTRYPRAEVARILRRLATELMTNALAPLDHMDEHALFDDNGNTVGTVAIAHDSE